MRTYQAPVSAGRSPLRSGCAQGLEIIYKFMVLGMRCQFGSVAHTDHLRDAQATAYTSMWFSFVLDYTHTHTFAQVSVAILDHLFSSVLDC